MSDTVDRLKTALQDRYTIGRQLGAGGMATVYLAQDLKHKRKVAVKVLRAELTAILGGERFLKEIEVTANLQHPNILPLYDSGEADGFLFYVMPYVEEETLRDRLNREKQLPVEETVSIATSVAAALSLAHAQGVIHRDVKPENILFQAGQAVVADFGIALAVSQIGGTRLTETGLSVGTPQYMSPEQASGDRSLDARSDVYSLGAVVYEMLTGDPPHTGNTVQAVVAKILCELPSPISQTRDTVPGNVEAAVNTALAKIPADRFATAQQFAEALGNPTFALRGPVQTTAPMRTGLRRQQALALVAAGVLAGVMGLAAIQRLSPGAVSPMVPATRFDYVLPDGQRFTSSYYRMLDISPDGRNLVYVANSQLYVRPMSESDGHPIPGTTDNPASPFFSPDGQWIAYYSGRFDQLRKVPTAGGATASITDAGVSGIEARTVPRSPSFFGGSWSDDTTIVFASRHGIFRVNAAGGAPELMIGTKDAEQAYRPHVLPGGRWMMFTLATTRGSNRWDEAQIVVQALDAQERRSLLGGSDARYLATGHLVYALADALYAVSFDLASMTVAGVPVRLVQGVRRVSQPTYNGGTANYAISRTGTFAFVRESPPEMGSLVWLDRQGNVDPIEGLDRRSIYRPRLSPDGRHIVFATRRPDVIWIYEIATRRSFALTSDGESRWPEWIDESWVAYASGRSGADHIYARRWDRAGGERQLADVDFNHPNASSLDGALLAFHRHTDTSVTYLTLSPRDALTGDGGVPEVSEAHVPQVVGTFSPGGGWIGYASTESGQSEVFITPFPGPGGQFKVSGEGGRSPVWRAGEVFYRSGNRMMAVSIDTDPELRIGDPVVLFEHSFLPGGTAGSPDFDVTQDGQRFLMVVPAQTDSAGPRQEIRVAVNWFEELKRLAPGN